jgi:regulator of sigma E protease
VNVFAAIVGLAALVLIHEAGHFFTAIWVGMRPRSFNIGFGPPLAKTTRKGILYAVRAVPLGGYVKIPGMHRPAASDLEVHFSRALQEVPELVGPVDRVRRRLDQVERDPEDVQAELERLREAVVAAPLSAAALDPALRGLEDVSDAASPEAYWRQRTWKRVAVVAAGPAINILVAILLFTVLFMTGGGKATSTVDAVLPDHPAAAAGLRPGDTILVIDNRPVNSPSDIPTRIQASQGRPITLGVQRDGNRLRLGPVRPYKDTDGKYRLGFQLRGESLGFPAAFWQSVKLTGIVTREIGKSLAGLVHKSQRKQLSSTVGIVQASSNAANQGIAQYMWVLGLISLSLALFNLLPLLPLDGGHIVFSLIEGLRGRAVGRAVYERASAIGIALMLLLFVVGLSNDIGRLSGG